MLAQLIANGIVAGAEIAIVAMSFAFIYSATRFFNFAHASSYLAGAYVAYFLVVVARCSLAIGVGGAVVGSILVGLTMEALVFRRLRRRGASSLILLLTSFGLLVAFQSVISVVFGDGTLVLSRAKVSEVLTIGGARITAVQAVIVVACVSIGGCSSVLFRFAHQGRVFRAIASDPELAAMRGVRVDRAILTIFAIGSGVAGLAGVLVGLDTDLYPLMGLHALLLAMVAAIVGGIDTPAAAGLGGLLIGFAQQFGVWKLPSAWQDAIAFFILIIFLLFRPQGFFGETFKRAS